MVKMSFSGSDSGQYSNVEPPGIVGFSATSSAVNSVWCSSGVQVIMEVKMPERTRWDSASIAPRTTKGISHNI